MNIGFEKRTVLVTGAAHGFGRAIAGAFAHRGARVFACDVVEAELAETAKLLGEGGAAAIVDVTDRAAVNRWVRSAHESTGRIDVLVNNAGGVQGQVGKPLELVSVEDWESIVAVNMTAAFWCAQAAAPYMKGAKYGRIVNISSGAGLGVSKAGQIGLTRQLAHELGPFGITVNNVAPGFVRSNPTTERQWESYGEDGQRALLEGIALRRLGTPSDIAHAVMFLASDFADWITGQVLPVDGGK